MVGRFSFDTNLARFLAAHLRKRRPRGLLKFSFTVSTQFSYSSFGRQQAPQTRQGSSSVEKAWAAVFCLLKKFLSPARPRINNNCRLSLTAGNPSSSFNLDNGTSITPRQNNSRSQVRIN